VRLLCKYLCPDLLCTVYISVLHSAEGQSTLPIHLQQERFCFINNRHRRLFAYRHLQAGQYVAQSSLHLHQCETHSWKENKKNSSHYLRNSDGFTISLILPYIIFNKIHYVHFADTIISADAKKQCYLPSGISSCKGKNLRFLQPWQMFNNFFPKDVENQKHSWIFLDKRITSMLSTTIFGSMKPRKSLALYKYSIPFCE